MSNAARWKRPVTEREEPVMTKRGALTARDQKILLQMHADLKWAREHEAELRRLYEGEHLVVVHKCEVIAHGSDEAQLMETAASASHPRDELVVVEILPPEFEAPVDAPSDGSCM